MNHWLASAALVRAVVGSAAGLVAALVLGEPVLLVLVTPLAVYAALAARHRPTRRPHVGTRLDHPRLHEGEATTWRLDLGDAEDVEHVTRVVAPTAWVGFDPRRVVGGRPAAGVGVTDVVLGARRWGVHELGRQQALAHGRWAGYRWGPVDLPGARLTVLPTPAPFDARAEVPQPQGLVGAHRSARDGDGTEFSGIRPFVPGDRLRRIDWRVSLRTGDLHVVTTRAEQDAGVLLVLDTFADHGRSGGVAGDPSSLDQTVRAALALAEHHLRNGDRVGLRVLGGSGTSLPYASGARHLLRIETVLAGVRPKPPRDGDARLNLPCPPGTVVFVLSPMLHDLTVGVTATLTARALPVMLIDTLPPDLDLGTSATAARRLAWRLRLLERDALLGRLAGTGCPVIPWRGPGTVDEVMRQLSRRTARPRAGAR